ncbi:unnamed protein product (macronuclear) [Paramecium tetraurelia]|uniref:Uncharacterized protein n=1 Tax=Paramecium tetraurelia TaxID=5888 RepID=A0D973_PARTE|nr:uncharacterized protein GSPATT00039331001 [Paramecium tetraurelia]CAK79590.1 unnamed protein product [Paramecium tetraurelia]|eukprot:XP_001446987.1 hypothetical protein (macronuclear) [Paramecium tetraurelia strain d4-2]
MIQSKMIEKEEELQCSLKHKLPVLMIACDRKLKRNQRLLCSECMENLESKAQLMSFKKVLQNIEENQKQKKENVENVIMGSIKLIEELQKDLFLLKSNVVQSLDQIIGNVDEWIRHIILIGQQNVTYSFYNELDNLINQERLAEFGQKQLIDQINQIQQSWNQKIEKKLNLFKQFSEGQKCKNILQQLIDVNETEENQGKIKVTQENYEISIQNFQEMIQVENKQKQLEQQLMMYKQVQFNLIDDSNQQIGICFAIVFNKDGSIMISCDSNEIKIWNFQQGTFKLSNSYNKHSQAVSCLVYSKKTNNFISGCYNNQIICWQQINQNEWKCSQPFEQHDIVHCLLLNKQEDQLISGGDDRKIIVWKVDFINNDLTFLYSLDQHTNSVKSLSFNQSETVLASCGYSHFIIWEKGLQGKWEFKYKQDVSLYGNKIHFMNDYQFLWVNGYKDDILNSNKTISLIKNNQCEDDYYFPIIHNKDRNVILVRHKHHIYLIRQLNDGTFNILASLDSKTTKTFGTITNNAQYLLFWDRKFQKYSSYEIQYK